MTQKPKSEDFRIILAYAGQITTGLGIMCAIPLVVAGLELEWVSFSDFIITGSICVLLGKFLSVLMPKDARPGWVHGMVATAFSWLLVSALAAIPYILSGHYGSYLDSFFDAMSGFTTTGLTLIMDLDHVSRSLNTWRHVITFVGGQGVVVLALSFLIGGARGGYELYVGEAKDERLFPHVINTAKAIWRISFAYLIAGTLLQWIAGIVIGLPVKEAFYHGLWVYLAAWSTGGFAPMAQNIGFYHSALYEFVCLVFFVVGSMNFSLHHAMLSGNRKELFKNAEILSFAATFLGTFALIAWALANGHVYANMEILMRKTFLHAISAHTTTGFMTIQARQFLLEWNPVALAGMIIAMLIGGSACSTAGGIKGLRVSGLWLAAKNEVRALLLPRHAVFRKTMHYTGDHALDDERVKMFALVTVMYFATWTIAVVAGLLCGYSPLESAFEAASVTGNVGLSIGVTQPSMPAFLKITYILAIWVGRLEFMAVLVLGEFLVSALRKKQ